MSTLQADRDAAFLLPMFADPMSMSLPLWFYEEF